MIKQITKKEACLLQLKLSVEFMPEKNPEVKSSLGLIGTS